MYPGYDCSRVVDIADEPRHHLVIANEFVRAFAVEIAPHDRTLCHRHPNDYVLFVANGGDIISAARGEEPKRLSYSAGECELSPAGLVHVVENLGEHAFRNVVVELLPRAAGLRRGAAPKRAPLGDEVTVEPIFDDERASVFAVTLAPGADIEILGPAVVATPYSNRLNPEALGEIEIKSDEICDMAWVASGRDALLWGCWEQSETAIVFQIGSTDEQGYAVSNVRTPLRSLRAHAEPE
ncbi:MAG TPA: hypothetical protein VL240_12620 [Candidatus Binatia bacterium]|nr:hypothetical protein [Candidatus Binatia bacterium]